MKYFTFADFEKTNHKKIDNKLSETHKTNVEGFVDNLLDPMRECWTEHCKRNSLGSGAILISSGYRSDNLNKAVNGSKTSAHCFGFAADIKPVNDHMYYFQNWLVKWLKGVSYDQVINEYYKGENMVASWIHIGWKRGNGDQRKQNLKTIDGKNYTIWI